MHKVRRSVVMRRLISAPLGGVVMVAICAAVAPCRSAGAATPAPITAGSTVTASVRIVLGGELVRPSGVRCTGTIGDTKVRGVPKAKRGLASCVYRTPRTAKGKTLRGTVSFTARGERYVRHFSARLR